MVDVVEEHRRPEFVTEREQDWLIASEAVGHVWRHQRDKMTVAQMQENRISGVGELAQSLRDTRLSGATIAAKLDAYLDTPPLAS